MGLFDRLFGRENTPVSSTYWKTLTAYSPVFHSWDGAVYESELVRSAIDAIARHTSKLKVEALGTAKPMFQNKIKHAPNQFQTWSQFLYRLVTIVEAQSNAFIVPVKGEYGEIEGYYPVLPTRCEIVDFEGEPYLKYKFGTGEVACERLAECGIINKFQYKDDFFGTSNHRALKPTMDLVNITNEGIHEAVKQSNTFRFMAKLNNFNKSTDLAKEQKRFTEESLKGEGGVLLFPNTWTDIKQINSAPFTVDEKQMEQIKTNVMNYFGVNEAVMQGKALGDDLDAFFNSKIEPFSIQLSEVLTKMTFTLRERSQGSEIRANANRLQYMPTSSKVALVQQLGDRGMLTVNEGRELFNYPPIDGGDNTMIRGEYYNGESKLTEAQADEGVSENENDQ